MARSFVDRRGAAHGTRSHTLDRGPFVGVGLADDQVVLHQLVIVLRVGHCRLEQLAPGRRHLARGESQDSAGLIHGLPAQVDADYAGLPCRGPHVARLGAHHPPAGLRAAGARAPTSGCRPGHGRGRGPRGRRRLGAGLSRSSLRIGLSRSSLGTGLSGSSLRTGLSGSSLGAGLSGSSLGAGLSRSSLLPGLGRSGRLRGGRSATPAPPTGLALLRGLHSRGLLGDTLRGRALRGRALRGSAPPAAAPPLGGLGLRDLLGARRPALLRARGLDLLGARRLPGLGLGPVGLVLLRVRGLAGAHRSFPEPAWPRKTRVGANSPSLCPTMDSLM